jgi:hypothetical protein
MSSRRIGEERVDAKSVPASKHRDAPPEAQPHAPKPHAHSGEPAILLKSHTGEAAPVAAQFESNAGPEGERLEREADAVAERVMDTAETGARATPRAAPADGRGKSLQRSPERQADGSSAPPVVGDVLRSPGRPLDQETRTFMESRFGHDLSHVRVHTGGRAADSARALDARAYTAGRDVVFGPGQYDASSRGGRGLIAHELAHVLQQGRGVRFKIQLSRLRDFSNTTRADQDPSRLTDAQIEATNEFKAYMDPGLVWQQTEHMTRAEALLACRLLLRAIRAGESVDWEHGARRFMNLARRQLGVLTSVEGQVRNLRWVPFNTGAAVSNPSALPTEFGRWVLAGGPQPSALSGRVNCWEMVLFGAFRANFITFARIQQIYRLAVENVRLGRAGLVGDTVEAQLRRGAENVFDPNNANSPAPLPGDIVIFQSAANHMAISRGTTNVAGEHLVLSLWNRPDFNSTVQLTTIEALLRAGAASPVKFWSANW